MNQPKVGQSVYYKARGSADGVFPKTDRAAIVTDVRLEETPDDGKVYEAKYQTRLCVMNPEGLFFTAWLDKGQEGGQWDFVPVEVSAA